MLGQLHCHSEYSLLDGIVKVPDIVNFATDNGIDFCSITDHGNISHIPELYFACKEKKIKPIFGCEFYFKIGTEPKQNYHLILIAQNEIGLRNLIQLSTKSFDGENFYRKPRITYPLLEEFNEGLICLTACQKSPIFSQHGERQLAQLGKYFFDRLYLEIMTSLDWKLVLKYCRNFGLPFIISKDVHYLDLSQREIHEVHLSSTGLSLQQYDLSYNGSLNLPIALIKKAKSNLKVLVDSIENIELDRSLKMPRVKTKFNKQDKVNYLLRRAKRKIFKKRRLSREYLNRLEFELSVFEKQGYIDYLWIVKEVCDYAKRKGIFKGWGRGSGAGSLLLFGLDIFEVDPIKYNLIFERFINPDRPSVPDIDIDFEHGRRDEIFQFCVKRFGQDRVCKIGTFHVRGLHSAFRDAGKHLGYKMNDVTGILNVIDFGKDREKERLEKKHSELFRIGNLLTGIKRNLSTHAAGIIISPVSLDGRIPLNGDGVSQWDMYSLEDLGWVKFDFLNSKTLTAMRICSDLVKEHYKVDMMMTNEVDTEDERGEIYKLISSKDTIGLFQFEGYQASEVAGKIGLANFNELVAASALCRPSALNQVKPYSLAKRKRIKFQNEKLNAILNPTRGLILYDDQVMRITKELAGFNSIEVDNFRKACKATSVKAKDKYNRLFKEYENKFFDGCLESGLDKETIRKLYSQMKRFESYGFNKNHATAYSIETYASAVLKCYFPLLYLYSLLVVAETDKTRTKYLEEIKRLDFEVENVDINRSDTDFTLDHKSKSILYGLTTVKEVGESSAKAIIENRPYKNFDDFLKKVQGSGLKANAVKSLIETGAFRPENSEELLSTLNEKRKKVAKAKQKMFGESGLF